MADVLKTGEVKIWTKYNIATHEPTILMTPEEWDRLAVWVEWQRKDKAFSKGES